LSAPKWKLRYQKTAQKQIAKLSSKDWARVSHSIDELAMADNPSFVPGVKHIQGTSNPKQWRQRQGDYRIIFEIESSQFVEMEVEYKGRIMINSISLHHTGY
jgi:mRNA-degrading endonuclease RelE of RelBE toxin-antitoxin system